MDDVDPWMVHKEGKPPTPLSSLIAEIEQDALAVYADHGLPTRAGHYACAPEDREWQFVAERLTPEQRWSFLEQYPPEQGWRFTTLEDLGRHAGVGERAIEATGVLRACCVLRETSETGAGPEALEQALRLGVAWRDLNPGPSKQAAEEQTITRSKPIPHRGDPD